MRPFSYSVSVHSWQEIGHFSLFQMVRSLSVCTFIEYCVEYTRFNPRSLKKVILLPWHVFLRGNQEWNRRTSQKALLVMLPKRKDTVINTAFFSMEFLHKRENEREGLGKEGERLSERYRKTGINFRFKIESSMAFSTRLTMWTLPGHRGTQWKVQDGWGTVGYTWPIYSFFIIF